MVIQNEICCYLQICLEELELFTDTVVPAVSQEHASKDKQRKNSAIIVEEVGNVILSSIRLLHIFSSVAHSSQACKRCGSEITKALYYCANDLCMHSCNAVYA